MANFDGLHEVRIFYSTTPSGEAVMDHVMTIDVMLDGIPITGAPFSDIDTRYRDLSGGTLEGDVEALVALLAAMFETSTSINRAELWVYGDEPSLAADFVSVLALGETGDSGSSTKAAAQNTMTLRTQGGGIMRVQLMETVLMDNTKDAFPFANAGAQAIANYLTGLTSPFVGRDNTYPIAASYFSQTQNEKLYKKRYRE